MLSGVSLLADSNVNNPVGLVGLPYVMRSVRFFVTHIQTEKISSWNGPAVHVCCFMLARASTKTFVSRIHIRQPSTKRAKKIFVSRKIRQQGHSLAEVSVYRLPSVRPCHGSGELSPASFHGKPGSMLGHSEWDSGFVSHYFSFLVRIIPPTRHTRISFIYHRRQSTEFTLEQATKGQRVEQRYRSTLSLFSELDRGGW